MDYSKNHNDATHLSLFLPKEQQFDKKKSSKIYLFMVTTNRYNNNQKTIVCTNNVG